jgi:hypothetical protein
MNVETRFTATTPDGYPIIFIWNQSSTINVYTGIEDDDGQYVDLVPLSVITRYSNDGGPMTFAEALSSCEAHMAEHYQIGSCDECGDTYQTTNPEDHDAEEGLCWNCSPNRVVRSI